MTSLYVLVHMKAIMKELFTYGITILWVKNSNEKELLKLKFTLSYYSLSCPQNKNSFKKIKRLLRLGTCKYLQVNSA